MCCVVTSSTIAYSITVLVVCSVNVPVQDMGLTHAKPASGTCWRTLTTRTPISIDVSVISSSRQGSGRVSLLPLPLLRLVIRPLESSTRSSLRTMGVFPNLESVLLLLPPPPGPPRWWFWDSDGSWDTKKVRLWECSSVRISSDWGVKGCQASTSVDLVDGIHSTGHRKI